MPASAAKRLPLKERAAKRLPDERAVLLLDHYRRTARVLPWRSAPGTAPPDPYRVWLSEVMLQQTTVATVAPRFARFVERWTTVEALAAAADEDILSEWAGLGYYARARNLIACARTVAAMGGFPTTEEALRALPGVGDYTAAAIAAIAFGRDSTPVDTNVARVVARLEALEDPGAVRAAAVAMTPAGQAGDFAQAMMDLGATICRPRAPRCPDCPLRGHCSSHALGRPEDFPPPKTRKDRPRRFGTAWWFERNDAIYLVRRPGRGLLGGMAALPGDEWSEAPSPPGAARLARIRHVFTHFALELEVVADSSEPPLGGWWQPLASIGEAGLPTLYRKAVRAVLESRPSPP